MKTLIPIYIEIKSYFYKYLEMNRADLTQGEFSALTRYSANEYMMKVMENSFFVEWEQAGRTFAVETWTMKTIERILKVYHENGGK